MMNENETYYDSGGSYAQGDKGKDKVYKFAYLSFKNRRFPRLNSNLLSLTLLPLPFLSRFELFLAVELFLIISAVFNWFELLLLAI